MSFRMAKEKMKSMKQTINQRSNGSNYKSYKDPFAMDVDRVETRQNKKKEEPTIANMPEPKKAELLRKGACFKCEQTGHLAKDCPQRNASTSSKPSKPWWRDDFREKKEPPKQKKYNLASAKKLIREMNWENKDDEKAFFKLMAQAGTIEEENNEEPQDDEDFSN